MKRLSYFDQYLKKDEEVIDISSIVTKQKDKNINRRTASLNVTNVSRDSLSYYAAYVDYFFIFL